MTTETCNLCLNPLLAPGAGPTRVGVRENPDGTVTYTAGHSRCADREAAKGHYAGNLLEDCAAAMQKVRP